jgi:hypothetical protein
VDIHDAEPGSTSFERTNVVLSTGFQVFGDPEMLEFLKKRDAFNRAYCAQKGWTERLEANTLTIEEILEIRSQPGWKNPK